MHSTAVIMTAVITFPVLLPLCRFWLGHVLLCMPSQFSYNTRTEEGAESLLHTLQLYVIFYEVVTKYQVLCSVGGAM